MTSIGTAAGIGSSILGHRSSKKAAKAQEAAYRAQAHNYLAMADAYSRAASAQAATAKYALRIGAANAKREIQLAAGIQPVEDLNLQQSLARRRAKVGEGRANFAANGVLVDSGAAALWEIDEAKDAAIERLQIMQSAEEQVYGHKVAAWRHEMEGYGQAAGAYAGAAQTAAQAYSAALNAVGAFQGAGAVQGPSSLATGLSIVGTVASGVGQGIDAWAKYAPASGGNSGNSGITVSPTLGHRIDQGQMSSRYYAGPMIA